MEGVTGETNGSLVENVAGKETLNGQPSTEVISGDLIWVKLREASWWPAQVVDENFVSSANKPSSKESCSDVLVRLYGSYIYKYVDIHRSHAEFKNVLMENNFNRDKILKKTLEQDLRILDSSKPRRRQQSKSKAAIKNEASQKRSSERDVSNKSQTKVSRKKQKQEKTKTTEAHAVTRDIKTKNRRPTHDGVPHDTEPTTLDTVTLIPEELSELSARRLKVMQNLGLVAPSGSPFLRNQTKVSRKKQKQEKTKTAEARLVTPGIKTKNKRPDGESHDSEPSSRDTVPLTLEELSEMSEVSARRIKIFQNLGLLPPSGSHFPAAVKNEASQKRSSERDVSNKSQTKVSRKKQKQEKTKTAEAHAVTRDIKTKNKRPTHDGVPHDTEPTTLDTTKVSRKKQKQEKSKTAEPHPVTPGIETKNKRPDEESHDSEPSSPDTVPLTLEELGAMSEVSARRIKIFQNLGLLPPSGSHFPAAVKNEASQKRSSERDVSNKSQVSRKKQKQEKTKTAEAHTVTRDIKTKNKRPTHDGVPHDTEPTTLDTTKVSRKKQKQEKTKTAEAHAETPGIETKNKRPDGESHDSEPSSPDPVPLTLEELGAMSEVSARRIKLFQTLGWLPPSGSHFPGN